MHPNVSKPEPDASLQASSNSFKRRCAQFFEKWGYWSAVLVGVAVFAFVRKPANEGLWIILYAFSFMACQALTVILHEMGHVLAAVMVGIRPKEVVIGRGIQVAQWRIAGIPWTFHAKPTSGHVLPGYPGARLPRLRMFVCVLGGPAVNAFLVVGAAVLLWTSLEPHAYLTLQDMTASWLFVLLMANGVTLWFNLVPTEHRAGEMKQPVSNDGRLLLQLIKSKEIAAAYRSMAGLNEVLITAREQLKASQGNEAPQAINIPTTNAAIEYWKYFFGEVPEGDISPLIIYALEKMELTHDRRNQLLDCFATWVLFAGASEHLEKADRYSEELLRNQPNSWTIKGTRGSVLVEKGEVDAGMQMLLDLMEHDPSSFDRAISACFLAMGEMKRGNLEKAKQWLEKARVLDPHCIPLGRIAEMVTNKTK